MFTTAAKTPPRARQNRDRERKLEWKRRQHSKLRDIGPIPPIENPRRRAACRLDLERFARTYHKPIFSKPFAPKHRRAIQKIEDSLLGGHLYAFAMDRGSGKTSLCRVAAQWSASYAHVDYTYIIGANRDKADETIGALKIFFQLPLFAADFPEIAFPIVKLNNVAQRSATQLCNGLATHIQFSKSRLVLATVPPPPNLNTAAKFAPTSGAIIGASGLTGDGIRGSLHTTHDGRQIRPKFALLDDPQTDESSGSPSQNQTREKLISGAVLGMAGPGQPIAAAMPCTIINPGDMADRLTNPTLHPLWRGERCGILDKMPADLTAWEPYFEIYRACQQTDPPDIRPANRYYRKHRTTLAKGAKAAWKHRKNDGTLDGKPTQRPELTKEIDAVQHAMNLYARDRTAFFSEYMNAPESAKPARPTITTDDVAARATNLERRRLPDAIEYITAYIDCQQTSLWYVVAGLARNFTCHIADYGVWPDPGGDYVTLQTVKNTLARHKPGTTPEAQLWHGLARLTDLIGKADYETESGTVLKMQLCLIDSGYQTSTVYEFCRRSQLANILLPSKGVGITAGRRPLIDPAASTRQRRADIDGQWKISRTTQGIQLFQYDVNIWKTFLWNRLHTPPAAAGHISIFAGDYQRHRMLAENLTAWTPTETEGHGRKVTEWTLKPGRDDHLGDALVGCYAAGHVLGCRIHGARTHEQKSRGGRNRRKARVKF